MCDDLSGADSHLEQAYEDRSFNMSPEPADYVDVIDEVDDDDWTPEDGKGRWEEGDY